MGSSRLAVSRLVFLICIFECAAEREDQNCNLKEVKKLQVSGPDPKGTPTDKVLCCCKRENPEDCSKQFGVIGKKGNTEGKYATRTTCPLGFHRDTYTKYKKYHEGKNPCKGLPEPEPAVTDAVADDADAAPTDGDKGDEAPKDEAPEDDADKASDTTGPDEATDVKTEDDATEQVSEENGEKAATDAVAENPSEGAADQPSDADAEGTTDDAANEADGAASLKEGLTDIR